MTRAGRSGSRLAIAFGCGVLVLVAMWVYVALDPHPVLDRWGFEALATTPGSWLGRHARKIANAGSVLAGIVVVYASLMAWIRGWWRVSCAVPAGFLLSYGIGTAIKAVAHRPRPAMEIIYAGGAAFPSTDAAISVGFVLVAEVLVRLSGDRIPRGPALAVGGAASLATGLLTVVFRDHALADVLAGWGLGAAVFSVGAALARHDAAGSVVAHAGAPLQS